jgi:sugar transferase (PEP-CTERM/EpsH1 system associated)
MLNRRVKILHVVHSFNVGGLENGVINLINKSNDEHFIHEICCMTKSGDAGSRLQKSVKIHEMHKRRGNDWRTIQKLANLITEVKPDIVHTRNWGTIDAIVAAKIKGVSAIIHGEHGWNIDDPLGHNFKRRMVRRILSGAAVDRFVAVSEDIRRWMIDSIGIKDSKITKILNGVDTKRFCPRNKNGARRALGFSEKDILIGTVGRLDPIKDQQLLLQAFSDLQGDGKELRLILIGDGPERRSLESVKEKLSCKDRIVLLGERNDVEKILPALDVFVLPSKNEGMSNTILEAMAAGLPIVATSVGGNLELVTQGKTGLFSRPGDIRGLTEALKFYMEHEEERRLHGANGRCKAEQHFSLNRMVEEYESLYRSLFKK